LISTGGGFIEGEKYKIDLTLKKQAHAIVTTQAPTYVYKCDNQKLTTQKTTIHLEEDSSFKYLMDEVIPYKNSRYKQETIIYMKDTADLVLIDGVTAGWSEDELPFQYANLQMQTTIYMNDKLFYNDHLVLEPLKENMASLGYFEGFSNYNSLIIVSSHCTDKVIEAIRKSLSTLDTKVSYGISKLEKPGFVLRTLGENGEENRKIMMHALNYFRVHCLNYPELVLSKNDHLVHE